MPAGAPSRAPRDGVALAYLFWHHPAPGADAAAYEEALRRFHEALGAAPAEGFVRSSVHRVEGAAWLPGGRGYEDWYELTGSAALDPLDRAAVAARARGAHDAAAALAAGGAGGLYRRLRPAPVPAPAGATTALWIRKPGGEPGTAFRDRLLHALPQAALWQRQMVLGPAPEFCAILPADSGGRVPDAWDVTVVRRDRVWG